MSMTDEDRRSCFLRVFSRYTQGKKCDCPLACEQEEYQIGVERVKEYSDSKSWDIYIRNAESRVTYIYEVQDYTLEDMLGAIGGILGLTIGASSLSVVEVCVYSVMFIVRKIY